MHFGQIIKMLLTKNKLAFILLLIQHLITKYIFKKTTQPSCEEYNILRTPYNNRTAKNFLDYGPSIKFKII